MILKIIGRAEDYKGANTHYKLTGGKLVTREEGVQMYEDGLLLDYHIYPMNSSTSKVSSRLLS